MSEKDAFTFLFEILKDLNKSYVENVMATLGFILLSMGWMVTSEKAREFLRQNRPMRIGALIVIFTIAIIHSGVSIALWYVSNEKHQQIVALNYTTAEYFEVYRLTRLHVALNLLMNLSAFGLLAGLVAYTKRSAAK